MHVAPQRNGIDSVSSPRLMHWLSRSLIALAHCGTCTPGPVRFADPAVGTGSFFSAALAVFDKDRIESAVGVEFDAAFCEAARDLWGGAGLQVVTGDFTRVVANGLLPDRPNLILANPPYVRHHHLQREDKERLQRLVREMAGVEVNGLAGLYVYFLLLATAWMEDGGLAAWLIPSEFMDVNYGAALKRFLCDRVTLIRIHRFDPDDLQFGDAFVSSAILLFRKTPPPPEHAIAFTFGGTIAKPQASEAIPLDRLRGPASGPSTQKTPTTTGTYPAMAMGRSSPTSSASSAASPPVATSSSFWSILTRAAAACPSAYLRPILPSPRNLKTTIIEPDDEGYPRLDANYASSIATCPNRSSKKNIPHSGNTCKPPPASASGTAT